MESEYIQLADTYLKMKVKWQKVGNNGVKANPGATDNFSLIDMWPLAIFSKINTRLNGYEVCSQVDRSMPFKVLF